MLEPFMGNRTLMMFVMMILIVVVGTALDLTPTVLILTPVLMPVVLKVTCRISSDHSFLENGFRFCG